MERVDKAWTRAAHLPTPGPHSALSRPHPHRLCNDDSSERRRRRPRALLGLLRHPRQFVYETNRRIAVGIPRNIARNNTAGRWCGRCTSVLPTPGIVRCRVICSAPVGPRETGSAPRVHRCSMPSRRCCTSVIVRRAPSRGSMRRCVRISTSTKAPPKGFRPVRCLVQPAHAALGTAQGDQRPPVLDRRADP